MWGVGRGWEWGNTLKPVLRTFPTAKIWPKKEFNSVFLVLVHVLVCPNRPVLAAIISDPAQEGRRAPSCHCLILTNDKASMGRT